MKKTTRKVPQSVKTQQKIDSVINEVAAEKDRYYKQLIVAQQRRHNTEIEQLKQQIVQPTPMRIVPDYTDGLFEETQQVKKSLLPVRDPVHGLLTPDAKQSWKRYSNITLALIIATQAFFASLDPVVVAALPDNIQYYIGIIQALVGIGASVINQTKRGKGAADV